MLPLCILELSDQDDKQMMLELYDQYEHYMYKVALGYTRNVNDAEDVVHNTWLSLCSPTSLATLRKFTLGQALELQKYLARCVRNKSIDLLRKRGEREFYEVPLDDEKNLMTASADISMNINRALQDEIDEYLYVLESMPSKQKEYLTLRYIEKHTYHEIARMLGKTEDSVRSQLSSAMKNFRNKVEKMREDYAR